MTLNPSAFENLKKRFLEGQERISELQARLKQRDRKGSHERVYQERDELLGHLQKSYLAFKEKYGENEELKKMVEDLRQSLKLCQEASAQVCICSRLANLKLAVIQ